MAKQPKILLIIETSRIYGRKLLRGIAQYALLNGPWQIERQAPFYLQHSQAVGDFSLKYASGVDGIIMREQKNIEPLIETGVPIVFASYLAEDFHVPMIRTDDQGIASTAAKYYLGRAFEHFAFVGYDGMFWSDNRKAAFAEHVAQAGFSCNLYSQPKLKKQRLWENELPVLSDWLKGLPKPVGLLACNDDRAQQVLSACMHSGLTVPEEVAIVGVDNDEFVCTLAHPPLSSVSLSAAIAGFEAASVLDRMIGGEKIGNLTIPVQASHVVTRQSSDILAIRDPVLAQSVNFIRSNIKEPIQIGDVLESVPVSRRCLYDKFKQILGLSVHQYIKKKRIEHIEHLLLDTDMTVSQIAFHMGFTSDDHIATYFRSVNGVNPHAFRVTRRAT
ncbi:MAG: XylR family transcriptional regulator [Anaerohalosphaeraceae bacterium]